MPGLAEWLDTAAAPYVIGFALAVPMVHWLNRQFRAFSKTPELAAQYVGATTRLITFIALLVAPVAWILAAALINRALTR